MELRKKKNAEEGRTAGVDVDADDLGGQEEAEIAAVVEVAHVVADVRVEAELAQRHGHFGRRAVAAPVQHGHRRRVARAELGQHRLHPDLDARPLSTSTGNRSVTGANQGQVS